MILHAKNDKDYTNSTADNIVHEEFCADCYTELHYYDDII